MVESALVEDMEPLLFRSWYKKNNKETGKNKIENNKQTVPLSLTKLAWNI